MREVFPTAWIVYSAKGSMGKTSTALCLTKLLLNLNKRLLGMDTDKGQGDYIRYFIKEPFIDGEVYDVHIDDQILWCMSVFSKGSLKKPPTIAREKGITDMVCDTRMGVGVAEDMMTLWRQHIRVIVPVNVSYAQGLDNTAILLRKLTNAGMNFIVLVFNPEERPESGFFVTEYKVESNTGVLQNYLAGKKVTVDPEKVFDYQVYSMENLWTEQVIPTEGVDKLSRILSQKRWI